MGKIRDRLASMTIKAASPDESVHVRMTRGSGIQVEFEDDVADFHTETTLAEQIEHAIEGALEGYKSGVSMIEDEIRNGQETETKPSRRHQAFIDQVDAIALRSISPKKYVTVEWEGENIIVIHLQNGTLRRLDVMELAAEVNSALSAIQAIHTRYVWTIHRRVFQTVHFSQGGKDSK